MGRLVTGSWLAVLAYMFVINVMTYLAFRIDKQWARAGRYRIPERRLLLLALMGGSPAALLAQRRLRHKTRKQPFSALLVGIALLQAALVTGLVVRTWQMALQEMDPHIHHLQMRAPFALGFAMF